MKKICLFSLFLLSVSPGLLVADIVVSSAFSGGEEQTSLVGLTKDDSAQAPDGKNVPGGVWQLTGGGSYDVWLRNGAARMHNGGAVGISLGDKAANALVTISAEVTFEEPQIVEGDEQEAEASATAVKEMKASSESGFALLGFYSAIEKKEFGNAYDHFTGLKVGFNGSLQLLVNGQPSGDVIAYGGTFNPYEPSTLTYTVNTATGAITEVSFGASTAKLSFSSSAFTKEATAFAGFGGSLGNHPLHVEYRNFEVSVQPVP